MSSADPYAIRPSGRWYAVVAVAWVIATICLFYAIRPMVHVFGINPLPIDNRATVAITGEGLTVYAATTASASGLGSSPSSRLVCAAACLTAASATINSG